MSSVDTMPNNVAATPSLMKNVLLSAAGAQVAPQSCFNTLNFHSVFFFSRLTTRSTNNSILHIMHFISGGLSLHTTIFDFIVRKGVPLIMVIQRTITGVKFPSVPCEPQIACPPQREPYGFQLHSQSGPRSLPLSQVVGCMWKGRTWCSI